MKFHLNCHPNCYPMKKTILPFISIFFSLTAIAQSAGDTSVPSRADALPKTENSANSRITEPKKSTTPASTKIKKVADFQYFKENGMTLYYGRSSSFLVNTISNTMISELKATFPKIETEINKPNHYGYQYHFRERWMMGLVFQSASVKTNTIEYPNFDLPGEYSKFHYQVRLSSFMGTIDYAWKIKSGKKSNTAWYSGLALGTFHVNFETIREDSSTAYVPAYNQGIGMNGIQATLVGVKKAYKNGLGFQAQLGAGVNSMGLSAGINYSFK